MYTYWRYWGLNLGYHTLPLEPCLQLFLFWLFWKCGLGFYPGWPEWLSFHFIFLAIAGMIGTQHCAQLFSTEIGVSQTFFVWAFLEWYPPYLSFPILLGLQT
jgi:hypothetical protein